MLGRVANSNYMRNQFDKMTRKDNFAAKMKDILSFFNNVNDILSNTTFSQVRLIRNLLFDLSS